MQPSLRYTSGAGYIVEYVAVLNLHWSVLFIISFLRSAMDLPKTCASREKSRLFSRFVTQQGAISLLIFYPAKLSNLWIVNNFFTNVF